MKLRWEGHCHQLSVADPAIRKLISGSDDIGEVYSILACHSLCKSPKYSRDVKSRKINAG